MGSDYGGMLFSCFPDRMDNRVATGSGQMIKKNYYLERNLDRLLGVAERRLEALKIIRELQVIDQRLKILNRLKPLPPLPEEEEVAQ